MHYAIISDVHANLEALNAVLGKIKEEKIDNILFLGDSVGYGPNPNECTESLSKTAKILLAGNHDWATLGLTDITYFNPYARAAIEWTSDVLSDENRDILKSLPLTKKMKNESIFLVHGTPEKPQKWHYLYTEHDAFINFPHFKEKICFVGHSHIPVIMENFPGGRIEVHYPYTEIKEKNRYIVNVGSVGQPRDGNPDATYAVLKENIIEIKRASYDIVLTQGKMRKAGLPEYLIDRLSVGR